MKSPAFSMPDYIIDWTDTYFHQSAFDVPISYPNRKTIKFLSQFKRNEKLKLYRGVNIYNKSNELITSWTHDLKIAKRYAKKLNGQIISKGFLPTKVLLDTTLLNPEEKIQLGYDHKIDDKEVLIFGH